MNAVTSLSHRAIEGTRLLLLDVGLLLLRLGAGGLMAFGHGWGKLSGYSDLSTKFPDVIGIGSGPTLMLAIGAEVVCAGAVVLGLFTRFATLPLIGTMLVAAFVAHGSDTFDVKERALLYLVMYVALAFTGPGRFSLDALLFNRPRTKA